MTGRLNWIFAAFLIAIVALLFRHVFATAWSNKCDPGNAQFNLMKNDDSGHNRFSRRDLLKTGGVALAGLAVGLPSLNIASATEREIDVLGCPFA